VRGRKRWLVWIVVVLLLAGAIAGGLAWRARPPAVEVAKARIGPAADLVYATGYVEAQQPVSVAARITAPVAQVLVSEGDRVRRGQPLVLLVDDEQRGLLDQAAARRAAEETERRTVTLYRQGWMTAPRAIRPSPAPMQPAPANAPPLPGATSLSCAPIPTAWLPSAMSSRAISPRPRAC
jgi:multidrug efflux pump subunit AcrA (membrane-fusion protein)